MSYNSYYSLEEKKVVHKIHDLKQKIKYYNAQTKKVNKKIDVLIKSLGGKYPIKKKGFRKNQLPKRTYTTKRNK